MAKILSSLGAVFLLSTVSSSLVAAKSENFTRALHPESLGLLRAKMSVVRFYFHDIVSGRNPSAVRVASAPKTISSPTFFGSVVMMDDPLTLGPDPRSTPVGRAQGMYASASQTDLAFLMVLNFVFTEGKYRGSTLSVLGRNAVLTAPNGVREMPIVGGAGLFRFASGYALAKTHAVNFTTADAVVKYKLYVYHF